MTSLLTIIGVALVVFIFSAVLMLSDGLRKTLVSSGIDDNAIVIRESSNTEIQSFVSRYQAGVVQTLPDIALDSNDKPMVAGEMVLLINKYKKSTGKLANIMVRGVQPMSFSVHKNVHILAGRLPRFGQTEIIVGKKIRDVFNGCELGQTMIFGLTEWTIVGVFEADGASFESEIWGDVDQLMSAFGRPVFSSMTFRMKDPSQFAMIKDKVMADPRMTVELKREKQYYDEQSRFTGTFIKVLGTLISIVFSIGAIIGAMITMYAAVANRTREIATMRALGFHRFNILIAFLIEALAISVLGGCLGLLSATGLQIVKISTINWDTFSDLSFGFALSIHIVIQTFIFALVMGILGGFLPAVRASRIKIIEALRAE
jgi:ABC-type antimicrobial peptide transport system permease subunit